MVSKMINVGLRAVQMVLTIIVLAIIAKMIAEAFAGNPAIINYDMFVAVFAAASLVFLIISAVSGILAGTPIPLILDLLNLIFFFSGAIAMSVKLGVHSCNDEVYTSENSIINGGLDRDGRCRQAQAATAFMWFAFAAFVVSTIFSALAARSEGVNLRAPGIKKVGLGRV